MHVCVCTCVYNTYMYVHYVYICAHMHAYLCVLFMNTMCVHTYRLHACVHMFVRKRVCVFICVCVRVCV